MTTEQNNKHAEIHPEIIDLTTRRDIEHDNLQLITSLKQIESRALNKDITSDIVLARLTDAERELAIEYTQNAYFAKRLINIVAQKATQWEWTNKTPEGQTLPTPTWIKKPIHKHKTKIIEQLAQASFDSYMIKVFMIAVTGRNQPDNEMVKILAGIQHKKDQETQQNQENLSRVQQALQQMNQPPETK